jgi:hypothetical protein
LQESGLLLHHARRVVAGHERGPGTLDGQLVAVDLPRAAGRVAAGLHRQVAALAKRDGRLGAVEHAVDAVARGHAGDGPRAHEQLLGVVRAEGQAHAVAGQHHAVSVVAALLVDVHLDVVDGLEGGDVLVLGLHRRPRARHACQGQGTDLDRVVGAQLERPPVGVARCPSRHGVPVDRQRDRVVVVHRERAVVVVEHPLVRFDVHARRR